VIRLELAWGPVLSTPSHAIQQCKTESESFTHCCSSGKLYVFGKAKP